MRRNHRWCPKLMISPQIFLRVSHHSGLFLRPRHILSFPSPFSLVFSPWRRIGSVVAKRAREAIRAETGLGCCCGIAHNKMLAKLVSSLHKPDQQTSLPSVTSCSCSYLIPLAYLAWERAPNLGARQDPTHKCCERIAEREKPSGSNSEVFSLFDLN